jgi:hypothetical protein
MCGKVPVGVDDGPVWIEMRMHRQKIKIKLDQWKARTNAQGRGEDTPCAAFALFILAYSGIDAIERTRSPM